jgi:hypothetical protein
MKKILILFSFVIAALTVGAQHGNFTDIRLTNGDSVSSGTNNGTIFYNRVSNKFRFRQNGSWVSLGGSGGGGSAPVAGNGITVSGSTVNWGGGTLTDSVLINNGGYHVHFTGNGKVIFSPTQSGTGGGAGMNVGTMTVSGDPINRQNGDMWNTLKGGGGQNWMKMRSHDTDQYLYGLQFKEQNGAIPFADPNGFGSERSYFMYSSSKAKMTVGVPTVDNAAPTMDSTGVQLINTAAASNGVQKQSPRMSYEGRVWNTSASKRIFMQTYLDPVQAATPGSILHWQQSYDNGAAADKMLLRVWDSGSGLTGSSLELPAGTGTRITLGTSQASITSNNATSIVTYNITGAHTWATGGVTRMSLTDGSALGTITGALGIGVTPTSLLHVAGSFATGYVAKTALYTLTATDHTVEVTSGTHTQTLPTAVGCAGRIYTITNSGTGVVTIGTTSSQTFVNVTATPTTLTVAQFHTYVVQSNGANWLVISSF